MGPTGNTRVVQIHPTRRCNLQCRHCYSSSSPRAREALASGLLRITLDQLAAEDYNWASFSGGEPLVYPHLSEVLGHACLLGMKTAVVTNGMLLSPRRLDAIQPVTDLLVISIDGKPDAHNRMRNSPRAFDSMATRLPELQARGVDFGFLFTLTQHNLDELPWVVEFAVNVGAKLLQIHPLDCVGNASQQLSGKAPDEVEGAHAWHLAAHFEKQLAGRLALQVDLLHTDALRRQAESFFLGDPEQTRSRPLGEQLSPLVIEPDGEVVPLQYGFARDFSLGNLHRHSVHDMTQRWRDEVGPRLHLVSQQLRTAFDRQPGQFIDWYARMAAQAQAGLAPEVHHLPLPVASQPLGQAH